MIMTFAIGQPPDTILHPFPTRVASTRQIPSTSKVGLLLKSVSSIFMSLNPSQFIFKTNVERM